MIISYTVWLFPWLDWSVLWLPPFELSLLTFRGSHPGEYIPLEVSESGIGTRLSSWGSNVSTLLFSSRIIAEVRRCIVHCTALKSRIMRPVSLFWNASFESDNLRMRRMIFWHAAKWVLGQKGWEPVIFCANAIQIFCIQTTLLTLAQYIWITTTGAFLSPDPVALYRCYFIIVNIVIIINLAKTRMYKLARLFERSTFVAAGQ